MSSGTEEASMWHPDARLGGRPGGRCYEASSSEWFPPHPHPSHPPNPPTSHSTHPPLPRRAPLTFPALSSPTLAEGAAGCTSQLPPCLHPV